jgi:hypothetical protein
MAEHDGPTWRDLGIQAVVVFGIAATAGGIAIYKGTHTDPTSTTSDIDHDGRPALSQGNYNNTAETSDSTNQPNTNNIPEFTAGYITRNDPRSRFKITPDPKNLGRQCVEKTNETPWNTVVGMTVVVAGDPNTYDGSGIIYDGNGVEIGTWDSGVKLIGFEDLLSPAYADAVACSNN